MPHDDLQSPLERSCRIDVGLRCVPRLRLQVAHWLDRDRIERHATVSESLARLSDGCLSELVDGGTVLGSGIGGTSVLVRVGEMQVFVKRVPLTELERQREHRRSTANLFGLPVWCQYGVGSPSFGV